MATQLSASFKEQFESEVKIAYQEKGAKLKEAVRMVVAEGEAVNFPTFGKGAAQARGIAGSLVDTMNISTGQPRALLEKFFAGDYVDEYDMARLSYDARSALAMAVSKAAGRVYDQQVINALNTGGTVNTIAANVEDGSTDVGLTVEKLRIAKRQLDDQGVDDEDRYLVCTPAGIQSLLGQTEVTSSDFNPINALAMGTVDTFLGFKFIKINDENIANTGAETVRTGLPGGGTNARKYFAFHKESVGLGVSTLDGNIMMDHIPERTAYLVGAKLLTAAVAIEAEGIVTINVSEA